MTEKILARSNEESVLAHLSRMVDARNHPLSPQEIRQRLNIVTDHELWAEDIARHLGYEGSLRERIASRTAHPVTSPSEALKGAKVIIGITGRTQTANRAVSGRELGFLSSWLDALDVYLLEEQGFSRRDIAFLHGQVDSGTDSITLKRLVDVGYLALGITKQSWEPLIDVTTKMRSDYVVVEGADPAWHAAFMGEGLGFRTDLLIVFEGNAGVKEHIKQALQRNIPVIVVPLTSDPLFIKSFADLRRGRLIQYRLGNIGRWIHEGERRRALPDLRNLILETLDLLDSSTTLEANPGKMFVMSDPREVAAFIARLDRQKQEQERRNSG